MNNKDRGSLRMGPISIVTLVIVLCLAVMSVLAVSTAQATYVVTSRQASNTTDIYAAERAAQEFLSVLDAKLATVRESGSASKTVALQALSDGVSDLSTASDSNKLVENVGVTVGGDEADVVAVFNCTSGRTLNVTLSIGDDATYSVTAWKTTTLWDTDTADTLWTGASTD